MQKILPLGDRVIVKVLKPSEKTKGGVILVNPGDHRAVCDGVITEVGPGRMAETIKGIENIPVNLKVGDSVMFSKGVGAEIKIDDVDYRVLHESDIIAVYETV